MALIQLHDLTIAYGHPPLLQNVRLRIREGERVGLVGRNGTGKSTLLRVIHGEATADKGEVLRQPGLRTAFLPQEVPRDIGGTVKSLVASALAKASGNLPASPSEAEEAGVVAVDHFGEDWRRAQRLEQTLARLNLDPEAELSALSAGLKRRALLARELVHQPELLLLDEPTNHLDIESIQWLEEFLLRYGGTLLFVTHDRAFLTKLATRIVEIDRGSLVSWDCPYPLFVERKEAALEAEARRMEAFDKKLAKEEAWLLQGLKARRTRNEGRVRRLLQMRRERRARRDRPDSAKLRAQEAGKSGKMIIEAAGLTFAYGEEPVVRDFSARLLRGDKVGIIGPNGSGKTTLLRLLLGELPPRAGTVRHGVRLKTAYFDQLREQLDPEGTVADNVGEGNDQVVVNGHPRHILGYLKDFLFSPQRARTPVKALSGGERNRVLLARLFTRPANVLVMDEPTNDLDKETLELLEALLVDYSGTVLVVSHDRTFLNHVVTSTLALEGKGRVEEYMGGYDDWLMQRPAPPPSREAKPAPLKKSRHQVERPRKLSYKERSELEALPHRIETLETEQKRLYETMGSPAFYQRESGEISGARARLEEVELALEQAYERWELLESVASPTTTEGAD